MEFGFNKAIACGVLAFAASFPPHSIAAESDRPFEREGQRIRALLMEGRFADLEAIEFSSRDLSVTISDGQQLRAAFFSGLGCLCDRMNRDDKLATLAAMRPRIEEWQKAFPQSAAAKFAQARYFEAYAWAIRGSSYASDVPEGAWPVYREYMAKAATVLDGRGESARDNPEWYEATLAVMRKESAPRGDYERLLEEALRRHPRFIPIYLEGVTHHSRTWGGSNAELKEFIDKAAARAQPWFGDTVYLRMQLAGSSEDMFRSGRADWKRMKAAYEKLVSDYPDRWNLNRFGNFACLAGDPSTTAQVVKKIEGAVIVQAWDSMDFYAQCKAWAQRMTPSK